MLDIKKLLTKILQIVRRLPNYYKPEGGYGNRPTTANIASDDSGGIITFLASSSMDTSSGLPQRSGSILHCNWDNSNAWANQLFLGHGTSGVFHRTQNANSGTTWGYWYPVAYTPIEILANANLNSYTTPGDYYCPVNATAATLTNSPVNVAFKLSVRVSATYYHVTEYNYRYRTQELVTYTGESYIRAIDTSNGGSTWNYSVWKKSIQSTGDTFTGDVNVVKNTGNDALVRVRFQDSNGTDKANGYLFASTSGNLGIYNVKLGNYVIYQNSSGTITIPGWTNYISGGTMSGNLAINHSDTTESDLRVSNTQADGYLYAGSGGNFGLYNAKLSHALIIEDKNGNVSIHNFGSTTRTATTLAASTSAHRSNAIGFEKIGHIVRVQIGILYNLPASTDTTIGTAPEGYRPAMVAQTMVFCTTTGKGIRIYIGTDGVMKAYNYGAAATGNVNMQAELMYFTLS